jgi:hypothetical protein
MAVPSNAINAQGVALKRGNGGAPEIFSLVGEVTKFDGPGGSASVIDVTTLQSQAKEKRMGLMDEGQFTITLNLDPTDAQQTGLRTDRANRTARNFQLVLTDVAATTLLFTAFVLEFKISGAVDGVVQASVTLEITGPVTGW